MTKVYKELSTILRKLEKHYKDMQDVEFTVEKNKLWILQTRSGKRTSKSAVKIAVDMVKENLISKKENRTYGSIHNIKSKLLRNTYEDENRSKKNSSQCHPHLRSVRMRVGAVLDLFVGFAQHVAFHHHRAHRKTPAHLHHLAEVCYVRIVLQMAVVVCVLRLIDLVEVEASSEDNSSCPAERSTRLRTY